MLTVLPEKDENICKEAIQKCKARNDATVFFARENNKNLGIVIVQTEKDFVEIVDFKIYDLKDCLDMNFEQKYIGEILLRTAGNYALNRNLFRLESNINDVFFMAEKLGIYQDTERAVIELSKLFKKCEKHC